MSNEALPSFAPVIVFAYNRPEHFQRTLDALRANAGIAESDLHIFCDGPKTDATPEMHARIEKVRDIARAQNFAKSTTVRAQEKNRGLAASIIAGVAEVVSCHGRAIVLEDDLETSPSFLWFMNCALDFYADYPGVLSIGGHSFGRAALDISADYPHDVFASPRACSWGFATWRDRWERVNWNDDAAWRECLANPREVAAFNRGGADLAKLLRQHIEGKIDSWAIRFMFAHFKHHAVTMLPCDAQVRNTGFDGSGVHCDPTTPQAKHDAWTTPQEPRFASVIFEDEAILAALRDVVRSRKRPWRERYAKKLRRVLRPFSSSK